MTTSTGLPALKAMLNTNQIKERFNAILGKNAPAFIASIIDLYGDPQIAQCDNNLIVKECLRAATMNLPINRALGYAYVITFNSKEKVEYTDEKGVKQTKEETVKKPTFIPSAKGYRQLAMRSGKYEIINDDVVYEGELVKKDKLTGEIDLSGERTSDKVIGYFAYIKTHDGFSKTLYMTLREMAEFAKTYSPTLKFNKNVTVESLMKLAGQLTTGLGWLGDFDEMAKKTCIRRILGKYGILSTEIQTAIENENAVETNTESNNALPEKQNLNVQDVAYTEVKAAEPKPALNAPNPAAAVTNIQAAAQPQTANAKYQCEF